MGHVFLDTLYYQIVIVLLLRRTVTIITLTSTTVQLQLKTVDNCLLYCAHMRIKKMGMHTPLESFAHPIASEVYKFYIID